MSNDANAEALAAFWQSTAPLSQIRENLNPPNGQYDLAVTKLEPAADDNGLFYINSEFQITAPHSIAAAKVGNTFRPRFYIGTKADPQAQLPETRLNSPGFSQLKGIARACQVPTNDQTIAALCSALIGKQFGNRIETKKVTKAGETKEYCNFGRNPTPMGVIPARLDTEAATVTTTASAPKPNGALAGATFGAE